MRSRHACNQISAIVSLSLLGPRDQQRGHLVEEPGVGGPRQDGTARLQGQHCNRVWAVLFGPYTRIEATLGFADSLNRWHRDCVYGRLSPLEKESQLSGRPLHESRLDWSLA